MYKSLIKAAFQLFQILGPTAKISSNNEDYVVTDGGTINFSASGSFSVVGIASYDWEDENTDINYNTTFSGNPNVVSLTVTDNFGASDTVTVNVTADADTASCDMEIFIAST